LSHGLGAAGVGGRCVEDLILLGQYILSRTYLFGNGQTQLVHQFHDLFSVYQDTSANWYRFARFDQSFQTVDDIYDVDDCIPPRSLHFFIHYLGLLRDR
jgi:hypothetical protein